MHIEDRRVDNERKHVPISATIIRKNIRENRSWLEDNVYNDISQFS